MISYQQESLFDILDEMKPVLESHYDEVALYGDKVPLNPDWDRYKVIEDCGILKMATVRDSGVLVGYYITMVTPNLHNPNFLYSVSDALVIQPEYRKCGVGVGLFEFIEVWMRELGVDVMTVSTNTSKPFDSLCEGLGWDYTERLYTKYIREN